MDNAFQSVEVAVLIPCYSGEIAVPLVIQDFRQALPSARIYVYDNSSTDRTAEVAALVGQRIFWVKAM
jgi:glycosyltransferase involved in cell wall biosynthesis